MFNAEEDDWMPAEEEGTTTNPAVTADPPTESAAEGANPFGEDDDVVAVDIASEQTAASAKATVKNGHSAETLAETPAAEKEDILTPVEAPGGEVDSRDRSMTIPDDAATSTVSLGKLTLLVNDPERHGDGQMAYITYGVKTISKRANVDSTTVRRRYSDFVWLNKQLELENPMRIIPQIPGKLRHKQLSRFDDDFIERRRFLLNFFLGRITANPVLSQSPAFIAFIQQPKIDFDHTKKTSEKQPLWKAAINVVQTLRLKNTDERFFQVRVKVSDLMTHLQALEKSCDNARLHTMDVATEMNECAPIFSEIGKCEPIFDSAMQSLDKAVALVVQEAVDKSEDETARVVEKLHEFHKLCEAVLALLTRRDLVEQAYEKASDDLIKKENEKSRVESEGAKGVRTMFSKKDPITLKQEKLIQLGDDIIRLKGVLDDAAESLKVWNKTVKAEIKLFDTIKVRDLKHIFSVYTKIHLNFYSRSKTAFERALPVVQSITTAK